jgi:hypothetical protein
MPSSEEETKLYTLFEGKSNDEIAEEAKLENKIKKIINKLPLPSKYRDTFCEIMVSLINEAVEDRLARFGERLGTLEKEFNEYKHSQELKDLQQDTDQKAVDKKIDEKVKSATQMTCVIAFFISMIVAIIAAFIGRG